MTQAVNIAAAAIRLLLAAALLSFLVRPASAQDDAQQMLFAVQHQIFGDIGRVEIEVFSVGAETRVTTRINIRAALLGVTLRRIAGECREVWRGNQLLGFESVITMDGRARAVRATFDGAHLIIETAGQRLYAPPDAQPENPWSLRYIHASTILSPESGELSAIEVIDLGTELVARTAGSIPVHHYLVHGEAEQHLYFDPSGQQLKLVHAHSTGKVTLVRIDARATRPTAAATASLTRGAPKCSEKPIMGAPPC